MKFFKIGPTAWIFNLLIIAFIAYELANLTWHVTLGTWTNKIFIELEKDSPLIAKSISTFKNTWLHDLFGQTFSPPTTVAQSISPPIEPPITQSDLTLLGILYADNSLESARALIHLPKIGERSYATGDLLGQMVIQNILADRVILENNNHYETLYLPKEEVVEKKADTQPKNKLSPETQLLMGKWWNNFQENPESILENVNITPAFVNGQFIGVELSPGKDPTFLEKFGIHTGDKVTKVNGVELTDPLKGMAVLGTLGTAQSLQFTVLRGSETHIFEFNRQP